MVEHLLIYHFRNMDIIWWQWREIISNISPWTNFSKRSLSLLRLCFTFSVLCAQLMYSEKRSICGPYRLRGRSCRNSDEYLQFNFIRYSENRKEYSQSHKGTLGLRDIGHRRCILQYSTIVNGWTHEVRKHLFVSVPCSMMRIFTDCYRTAWSNSNTIQKSISKCSWKTTVTGRITISLNWIYVCMHTRWSM